jgi:hypothetical protein
MLVPEVKEMSAEFQSSPSSGRILLILYLPGNQPINRWVILYLARRDNRREEPAWEEVEVDR